MEIAVYADNNGKTVPFYESGTVSVYTYNGTLWRCVRNISFKASGDDGFKKARDRTMEMVSAFKGCRTLIIKDIKGIALSILNEIGFSIWKFDGEAAGFLNYVREHEIIIETDDRGPNSVPNAIGDIRDGMYRIDLKKILESDVFVTSKQVLRPFFQKTSFKKLEIICEHVPKWFDKEFGALKLRLKLEESKDGLCHVSVYPEQDRNIDGSDL